MNSLFKQYEGVFDQNINESSKDSRDFEYAYSPFALQDAIGEKSAKKAWIEYQKLRFSGVEPNELVYKIVSKIRDMLAITIGANKDSLGLKDYTFNKSKRDLKNWKKEDLNKIYTDVLEKFHKSRMFGEDLDISLEKILLSI